MHEHQRKDRETYMTFHCENLEGYSDAYDLAEADPKELFNPSTPIENRMYYVYVTSPMVLKEIC